jgi:hypothetical protein
VSIIKTMRVHVTPSTVPMAYSKCEYPRNQLASSLDDFIAVSGDVTVDKEPAEKSARRD